MEYRYIENRNNQPDIGDYNNILSQVQNILAILGEQPQLWANILVIILSV